MNQHKKIIFIHLLNDYSGSPKVLSQVINTFKKNNFDIELYTGKGGDGFLSHFADDEHYHYPYKRFNNRLLTLLSFMLSQLSLFFKLLKYRDKDVIIYVNTLLPFGAALAGKLMKKPVYYHIHETSITPLIFKNFLRTIAQFTAIKIIFVSKAVKKLEPFLDIPQEVIYNTLSDNFVKVAAQNKYSFLYNKTFNILMICSLKTYKGIHEYVKISALCEQNTHIKFTLILNAEESEIDLFFKEISIPSNLSLLPKQKNLVPFYSKTSLLLNLSRIDEWIETFGLTIIEGMAFGIPSIVPPIGGPAEIVSHEKEGYLISSYKTDVIAKKIQALSVDEKQCQLMSKASKEKIKHFNEQAFEEKILEVLSR